METSPPATLHQVFYVSRCTADGVDIRSLYDSSQRNNERLGLSGALLFTGGCFAQVLEGPAPAVQQMMAVIEADPRHCEVRRLLDQPLCARGFGAWRMKLLESPGADDLVQTLLAGEPVSAQRAQRLLALMFAEPAAG